MKIHKLPEILSTIIFDMDGTLYTSPEYLEHQDKMQICHFAETRGLSPLETLEEFDLFRKKWQEEHNGKKISLANTFVEHGVPIETVFEWRNELADPEEYIQKDEKLIETLEKLNKRFKLAVVTNNSSIAATKTLKALGVDHLLKNVVSLDISRVSKPHRRPFELAAEMTKSPFNQCLSIGDRYDIDLALPMEMGMGGIEVTGAKDLYILDDLLR